ncbi:MAG: hypothetical protein HGA31_05755 [Candidatus Moranbacteria bacterium]|nr:hypothetical protein [Candidatus Moranbacteria bacterium]
MPETEQMKTTVNFEFVESAFRDAVQRELASPTLSEHDLLEIKQKTNVTVAGFDLVDARLHEDLAARASEQLKTKLDGYEDTSRQMREQLKERGIRTIATLTVRAWNNLYTKSGLYELDIDEKGKVVLESVRSLTDKADTAAKRVAVTVTATAFIACAIIIVIAGIEVFRLIPNKELGLFSSIVGGLILFVGIANGLLEYTGKKNRNFLEVVQDAARKVFLRSIAKKTTWAAFLRIVMPEQHSKQKDARTHRNISAKVLLPEPPDAVKDVLLKAQGLPLKTVADPKAFGFAGGIEGILLEQDAKDDVERNRLRWLKHDPIVVWEKDGVAAILAQFGDSPIEKRVVEMVTGPGMII